MDIPIGLELKAGTHEFLEKEHGLMIGGAWVKPNQGGTFSTINPANGKALCSIGLATEEDVNEAVFAARRAFEGDWSNKITPAERGELMWKLADLMQRDAAILMELETLDNGKPLDKAEYDIQGAIKHFRYYAGWATKIEGSTIPVGSDKLVYTQREPLGVVGLIVPWNFPLMIASWKLAPALACGNCCVLKPAEQTPLTALYLGKLIQEAGFPDGVVNIVTGPGDPTGEAMSNHLDVDKISFTGSTAVGRKIMAAAAMSNLKKVSLELGGKSPNVIFKDALLELVNQSLVWSSFYNTGQECTLGSRVYIQEEVFESVVDNLIQQGKALTIGNGLNNPDLGPMVSESQMNRVLDYVQIGQTEATELLLGGERCQGDLSEGYFLPPTIFSHKTDHLKIVQEEIFGPVVCVSPFKDYEEVAHRANASIYGLAAAVWTNDIKKAHRFAHQTKAGTVWINGYDLFDAAVPFGGYKASGIGKEMGKSAIELFTQEKSIWVTL